MGVLIKNNLKLMLRNKWIVIAMCFFPLVIIGLLSNIFDGMLSKDYSFEKMNVGYSINQNNDINKNMPVLKEVCSENKIYLSEYGDADAEKLIKEGTVDAFVKIEDSRYTIYESSEKESEALVLKSMLSSYFYGMQFSNQKIDKEEMNIANFVESKKLDVDKVPSATDYYGIIEIVYFTTFGMVSLAAVVSSERKNKITKRFKTSGISSLKLYLAKLIPCFIAVSLEMGVATVSSVLIFDIHWGNIPESIGIILLLSLTSSAFGIALYNLFNSSVAAVIVTFLVSYLCGFTGGTFATYMYTNVPQNIMEISPIYYVNRTLVEFSSKGSSEYAGTCVICLIGILLVSSVLGMILMNKRKEAV